jgi:predicted Zn-dependent protease
LALQAYAQLATEAPLTASWWQAQAALNQNLEQLDASRQQLAIAHALKPNDAAVTQAYLIALLNAGHADEALAVATEWINTLKASIGEEMIYLGVRAAHMAKAYQQGLTWLQLVKVEKQQREWHEWSLYLSTADNDLVGARRASEMLIALGAGSPQRRLHAASLAMAADDGIAAESHLRHVIQNDDKHHVHLAQLHLARLYIDQGRLDEAEHLLNATLTTTPEDAAALGLLRVLKRAAAEIE